MHEISPGGSDNAIVVTTLVASVVITYSSTTRVISSQPGESHDPVSGSLGKLSRKKRKECEE